MVKGKRRDDGLSAAARKQRPKHHPEEGAEALRRKAARPRFSAPSSSFFLSLCLGLKVGPDPAADRVPVVSCSQVFTFSSVIPHGMRVDVLFPLVRLDLNIRLKLTVVSVRLSLPMPWFVLGSGLTSSCTQGWTPVFLFVAKGSAK